MSGSRTQWPSSRHEEGDQRDRSLLVYYLRFIESAVYCSLDSVFHEAQMSLCEISELSPGLVARENQIFRKLILHKAKLSS